MRRALIVSLVALALCAPVALALPPGAPPQRGGGPPPAWLEKPGPDRWLAYSSYCWTVRGAGMCADFIAPQMRSDLPRIRVVRGTPVRFHLGFRPIALQLSRVGGRTPWRLAPARGQGVHTRCRDLPRADARVVGGDASYVFRVF